MALVEVYTKHKEILIICTHQRFGNVLTNKDNLYQMVKIFDTLFHLQGICSEEIDKLLFGSCPTQLCTLWHQLANTQGHSYSEASIQTLLLLLLTTTRIPNTYSMTMR